MVIHPLAFSSRGLDAGKMIALRPEPETDKQLVTSLAWQKFLPTEASLHEYGCRLAGGMNDRLVAQGKKLKDSNRRIYCGSYHLKTSVVRQLVGSDELPELSTAYVLHEIENDEIAHANLRIIIREDWQGDIAATMTAIVDRLWNGCQGPLKHICDCDRSVLPHPSAELSTPPSGGWSFTI